ncbi:MAG TPA: DNA polymerase IV, partial [Microvirga sp.]|nr:DNA polymerase IV [Microvirga sp.]
MDAFYASVEQRDNPELRGKPVAVGGSSARGVVAAASYEARRYGVRSAMASVTAKRKCPDLIFVKPRFDLYKEISLQIRAIFAEYTPVVEPLSLDETILRRNCDQLDEAARDSPSGELLGEPERPRKIIHIDMDAFYASVEQRDNPELRGKPVAVGGSSARGVVAAASYEARRYGVRSAMASVTAKRKCPDLIFVKPRFEVYRDISFGIRAIFAEYTSLVEPLSLDEAYLDVTENLRGIASATRIAEEIRQRIRQETGLTASAGVSYNKFLAKLASDQRKPDGMFVITPRTGPAFVEELPVGKFHGVGPVTAARMNRLGIFTGRDLKAQPLGFLQERFGKAGAYYYWIARGVD